MPSRHHTRPLWVALVALAGCEPQPSVNCDTAEALNEFRRFEGVDAAEQMRAFCFEHRRGAAEVFVHVEATPLKQMRLPCVCSLTGLWVSNNPGLEDLTGLENVRRISGGIKIVGNPGLTTLAGLPSVTEIGEMGGFSIYIEDNDLLRDLSGLPGDIVHLGGGIWIRNNDGLTSLEGFPKRTTVIDGGVGIYGNPQLAGLGGLPQLIETLESFAVSGSDRLTDLTGFPASLTRIDRDFSVSANSHLENMRGVPASLESVGELDISGNNALVDLTGFASGLEIRSRLTIAGNASLRNLMGLPDGLRIGLDEVEGRSVFIDGNEHLEDLSGLPPSLTSIPGRVTLQRTRLKNLAGLFDNLRSVGSLELLWNDELQDLSGIPDGTILGKDGLGFSLYVVGNNKLKTLAGLPASFGALPGGVSIVDNASLVDLSGLEMLRSVGGDLLIGKRYPVNLTDPCFWDLEPGGNQKLTSLAGLSGLESIGGTLTVACNPLLEDFNAFGELQSVGNDLNILVNLGLTGLSGLGGVGGKLRSIGGTFWVQCNPGLNPDEVTAVFAEVEGAVNTKIHLACD